jgi:ferritin
LLKHRHHSGRAAALRLRAQAPEAPAPAPAPDVALTGFVFQPFLEVEQQMGVVDGLLSRGDVATSAARTEYSSKLEAAVNAQIKCAFFKGGGVRGQQNTPNPIANNNTTTTTTIKNSVELSMSYAYSALAAFFDRDNVGLPGFASRFAASSDDERTHAYLLMAQQNRRGGRVALAPISRPVSEFFDDAKGDALHGVEVALALEKLNFLKLRQLHAVACEEGDAEMTQFIEDALLRPQAAEVRAGDMRGVRGGVGEGNIKGSVLVWQAQHTTHYTLHHTHYPTRPSTPQHRQPGQGGGRPVLARAPRRPRPRRGPHRFGAPAPARVRPAGRPRAQRRRRRRRWRGARRRVSFGHPPR